MLAPYCAACGEDLKATAVERRGEIQGAVECFCPTVWVAGEAIPDEWVALPEQLTELLDNYEPHEAHA